MKNKKKEQAFDIFTGNANPILAKKICEGLGFELGEAVVTRFSDGEVQVEINNNVRKREVFIVQPTCRPVNENLVELLVMIDALKRAAAEHITVVLPYYGYARQDAKKAPRVPITAKLVADLLQAAGAHRIIAMDLHAGQIQGFFNIPVDNLFSSTVLIDYIREKFLKNLVIVSPDAGGVERARAFAKRLDAGLAIVDKRRKKPGMAEAMGLIGEVEDKTAVILDDMVDTAGTLKEASELLERNKASEIHAAFAHPVLSGKAIEKINASPIRTIVCTDSIPLTDKAAVCGKIKVLTVANMIGEAMRRSFTGDSVTSLFV